MSDNPYQMPIDESAPQSPRMPSSPSRVGIALACLHISAVGYVLLGFVMPALFSLPEMNEGSGPPPAFMSWFMFAFCFAIAIGVEVVAYGVQRRKFWGWVAGLAVFGMYATSICFPLGGLGLWGLLAQGSREEFGIGTNKNGP